MENMTTTEIIFATDENVLPIYNCINNMNIKEDYLLSLYVFYFHEYIISSESGLNYLTRF